MTTEIKKEIKKIVKRKGSHIGVVKHIITSTFENVNFEDYKEFTLSAISDKLNKTESKLRAGIRYQ